MALGDNSVDDVVDFRLHVVAESIRLFADNGYESTSVDQIAAAAGVSRRTFFRQFGSKEDVIFADHEVLLAEVSAALDADDGDPWTAVCLAAERVFGHFLGSRTLALSRTRVVQEVPALRDRELITTYRYQRLFEEFLRSRLPDESPVHVVAFAAAITSAHNYLLRSMIRGDADATLERLRRELTRIRLALGAGGRTQVAVVTYPAHTSADEIARAVAEQIGVRDERRN